MAINILEEFERAFGEDFAKKFIIRSIIDFPKGFEMPIPSIEAFEKMVRMLPCSNVDRLPVEMAQWVGICGTTLGNRK